MPPTPPTLTWHEADRTHSARWRSERDTPPPAQVAVADDTTPANTAFRLASEGTALLWRGDFQNARHLLQALTRRVDKPPRPGRARDGEDTGPAAAFHRHRRAQARRAQVLSQLLIPLQPDYAIAQRRAPDVRAACEQAWGAPDGEPSVVSLRELLGLIGAFEWRRQGVEVPALGPPPHNRIHPHYGVFSPVRGEYVDLVAQAPLPAGAAQMAFDVGTGSGVLAAVLARRGVQRVLATDHDERALACAADNLARLGLAAQVELRRADLFPAGEAALIVCNPPWLPTAAGSAVERAVYDEDSRMLRGFLAGLRAHLAPGGEGWLILSDIAEHLGLRTRAALLQWIDAAGLVVRGRIDTRPRHAKARDSSDPLHAARAAEVTSLWRLGAAP